MTYPLGCTVLQGLYDELLRGSTEIFSSSFQSKAKKVLDTISEDKKKKVGGMNI